MIIKHVKNIFYLFTSKGLSTLFAFIAQILLARLLTQEDYGTVSFYIILINLISSLLGFGLGNFWLRRFATEGYEARRWILSSLKGILVLSFLVIPIYFIVPIISIGTDTILISLSLLPLLLFQGLSSIVNASFQLTNKYTNLSYFMTIKNSLLFVSSLTLFIYEVSTFYIIYGLLSALLLIYSLVLLQKFNSSLRKYTGTKQNIPSVFELYRSSWPFAIQGTMYMLYYQVDIIIITVLLGTEYSGLYNASFTIISLVFAFSSIFFQIYLLPRTNVWIAESNRKMILFIRNKLSIIAFVFGGIIALVIYGFSDFIITLVYGAGFTESIAILNILIIAIPFRFMANSIEVLFTTEKAVIYKVFIQSVGAITNIALNFYLINEIGVLGAAISTVFTELIVLFSLFLFSIKVAELNEEGLKNGVVCYKKD